MSDKEPKPPEGSDAVLKEVSIRNVDFYTVTSTAPEPKPKPIPKPPTASQTTPVTRKDGKR